MSRLTRDGTAEPVSRDQILRHARGQGNIIFPVQLTTSRIGNLTRFIHTLLYVMTIHGKCLRVHSLSSNQVSYTVSVVISLNIRRSRVFTLDHPPTVLVILCE